jgi:hypothetical protein
MVAAWQESDGSSWGIFGQRLNAQGLKVGPALKVNQVTASTQQTPVIAVDPQGNFLIAWESFNPDPFDDEVWQIKARLFRANGKPVGPEITVNQHRDNYQQFAHVAFMGDGQFLVGWNSFAQVGNLFSSSWDVFVRRFSASKADEPCLVSQGLLRCDTGRTGSELEVVHPFGVSATGPTMLGDIDGDGRADPCEWANGRFRCDTDHEGGVAEVKLLLSGTGAPLLGDVDGDGRADACLYTTGRFSCDTAHNGGKGETVLLFGKPGQTPLLGDLDGDGRDDACTFANGVFRCETKNNGGGPEVVITFGETGDQALLGDFDGDGDDEPCVYRAGQLLCDTAHDGGAADGVLTIGAPGDRLVLGNLDGL